MKQTTRTRLQALGAVAGFAFVTGLSGVAPALATGALTDSAGSTTTSPATTSSATMIVNEVANSTAAAIAAPNAPTEQQLHPVEVTAAQQTFIPDAEQMANATAIVETGKKMGLPPRAWVIAVATSLQESNLHNLGHLGERNDHDSLGLFQQRPSSGWGTPGQLQDPNYAATAFYKSLVKVNNWESLPLTVAAQKVQVSAFPNHYAKHERQAGDIVAALHGAGPYAHLA